MDELRIIRGTDIGFYVDDTPLFGVTAFSAVKKTRWHDVYEYGCPDPCERVPQGVRYELKLSIMSLFDGQMPSSAFILRAMDCDSVFCYEGCRVIHQETKLNGNGHAEEVFTVEAERMRKEAVV